MIRIDWERAPAVYWTCRSRNSILNFYKNVYIINIISQGNFSLLNYESKL